MSIPKLLKRRLDMNRVCKRNIGLPNGKKSIMIYVDFTNRFRLIGRTINERVPSCTFSTLLSTKRRLTSETRAVRGMLRRTTVVFKLGTEGTVKLLKDRNISTLTS